MSKNYMKQIAEMLGVELEEEFNITDSYYNPYRMTEEGLKDCGGGINIDVLSDLLIGVKEIITKPFIPKKDEKYYFIYNDGSVSRAINDFHAFDYALINMGNCFKTEELAEVNKGKIIEKFKEIQNQL